MVRLYHIFCLLLLGLLLGPQVLAQKDFLGIPSIHINTDYFLKWSAKTRDGKCMEEFLPKNDSYTKFTTKIILECTSSNSKTLEGEIKATMAKLALKKEENIVFSFQQIESPNNNELLLEYIQGDARGGQPFVLEWNLCRYLKISEDRILMIRMCRREYDEELEDFMKKVGKKRLQWIKPLTDYEVPRIEIK